MGIGVPGLLMSPYVMMTHAQELSPGVDQEIYIKGLSNHLLLPM